MSEDKNLTTQGIWPQSEFYFSVKFESQNSEALFQEVTGLDNEAQSIKFKADKNWAFSTLKMPGIKQFARITLKKGIFSNDNIFFDWYNAIKMNDIKSESVIIRSLDESGIATFTWTLTNAWITKITSTDLKSVGNEVAVETIEIMHHGLSVSNS